jgi:RNA polymerase sigma-70 factor (ECF subfamily)
VQRDESAKSTDPLFLGSAGGAPIELSAAAALTGDRASLERAWEDHRRWVAAILLAYKPRWVDVDDLLQDVALTMVRNIHEVRDPRALRPWLRTVAINACLAAARRGKVRGEDKGAPANPEPVTPEIDASRTLDGEALRLLELAAEIPDGYREPLLLKAVEGLSYRQIGLILGLPESTVETRVARGRRQLRDLASEKLGV